MTEVIPSFYQTRAIELDGHFDGHAFNNHFLRIGEVVQVIYPEDVNSRSGKFIEYNVVVQHRENGTSHSKLYENVLMVNPFAGLADKAYWTLRTDPLNGFTDNNQNIANDGVGSKVLILCINAEHASGVIIGGVRDTKDDDLGLKPKGHHAFFVFNGVSFAVNQDGSLEVVYGGKTDANGDTDADENAIGTSIKVTAEGNFVVTARDQSITIDNKNENISVQAKNDLVMNGKTIHIGNDANEMAVLGNTLVNVMGQILDAITRITHITPVGNTSPPINIAEFQTIKAQLNQILSTFIYVKK